MSLLIISLCIEIYRKDFSIINIQQQLINKPWVKSKRNVFKKLKEKYPQTAQADIKDLPNIPTWPADGIKLDLLKNFKCASFSDPDRLNYQTTYQDISFLLNTAIKL